MSGRLTAAVGVLAAATIVHAVSVPTRLFFFAWQQAKYKLIVTLL